MKQSYIHEKGLTVIGLWVCEWRRYKTIANVIQQFRENFFYRRSLTDYQRLEEKTNGIFVGYVQCDIQIPAYFGGTFANFPLIHKKLFG